ncbi:LysR family transcriptional regulator [Chania multitudinisentens]|nr:LysR family transcriptional regulator [Chania multitudinisentens]
MTVARVKSLNKASMELFITQSPICRSLKKFEGLLGVKLFIRKKNGLILTEDGLQLYNDLIEIYLKLNELECFYKKNRGVRSD